MTVERLPGLKRKILEYHDIEHIHDARDLIPQVLAEAKKKFENYSKVEVVLGAREIKEEDNGNVENIC